MFRSSRYAMSTNKNVTNKLLVIAIINCYTEIQTTRINDLCELIFGIKKQSVYFLISRKQQMFYYSRHLKYIYGEKPNYVSTSYHFETKTRSWILRYCLLCSILLTYTVK